MTDKQLYLILRNKRQMQYIQKEDPLNSVGSHLALVLLLQKHFFYCQHLQLRKDVKDCKQHRENTCKCCFSIVSRSNNVFTEDEKKKKKKHCHQTHRHQTAHS